MTSTAGPSVTSVSPTLEAPSSIVSMVSSNSLGGAEERDLNGDSPIRAQSAGPVRSATCLSEDNDYDMKDCQLNCRQSSLPRQSLNKRKNFKPRNIVYHFSDSDCDEDASNGNNGEQPLDLSSESGWKLHSEIQIEADSPPESVRSNEERRRFRYSDELEEGEDLFEEDRCASPVIDLSRGLHVVTEGSSPSHSSTGPISRDMESPGSRPGSSPPHTVQSFQSPPVEGATMKDYAESTMKELLGMYGLNDGQELPVSRHLPLHMYGSGEMLESLGLACYPPPSSALQLLQRHQVEALKQERLYQEAVTSRAELPGRNEIESLRNKMMNVSGLSAMTSNSAIPSPQVMMPQNMATIFTIAALGSKLPPQQLSDSTPIFSNCMSSPHHSSSVIGSVSSTPSPVVSSSHHNSNISTSYKAEHHKLGPVDYTRYVKKFPNANECGSSYCKDFNYKEHFHCLDCNSRVFVKKEEMIRHFKWHKKRDESLQHGFMRYSPMDDCSDRFRDCSHNRKQTHYHCLKESCDKVYISTSDVQMHANYHRKDTAIIQEGFQRFRATENCATVSCLFFGQRTTHFHCRRTGCSFTFKNKADMEKHKTYHIKDEQLNKDGFKKFMKHEHCTFGNCRFSRVCNHIHCIRPGCTYVLHSSGQLYSHKRKHERKDTELAYRKFKLAQSMMKTLSEAGGMPQNFLPEAYSSGESSSSPAAGPLPLTNVSSSGHMTNFTSDEGSASNCYSVKHEKMDSFYGVTSVAEMNNFQCSNYENNNAHPSVKVENNMSFPEEAFAVDLSVENSKDTEDLWKVYLTRYGSNTPCQHQCEFLYKDHFHCSTDNCSMTFRAKDILGVQEHASNHEYQEQVTKSFYTTVEIDQIGVCPSDCLYKEKEKHYHCKWENCQEVISSDDNPFRRLDHYKIHKYSRKLSAPKEISSCGTSAMDNMFRRKRGRPPKNRLIEFPMGTSHVPQAIYTSFKLPKPSENFPQNFPASFGPFTSSYNAMPLLPPVNLIASSSNLPQLIPVTGLFPPASHNSSLHDIPTQTHTNKEEMKEGFYTFHEKMPCPDKLCIFYGQHHFHCSQPRCYYVTDRNDILLLHSKDFHDNIDIMDGFVFFDRSVDCRLPGCHSNKINRHFHCIRANCNYSFVRYSTMTVHEQKHQEQAGSGNIVPSSSQKKLITPTSEDEVFSFESCSSAVKTTSVVEVATLPKATVVKAAGTFYPLSAFSTSQTSSHCSPGVAHGPTENQNNNDKHNKDEIAAKTENSYYSVEPTDQPLSRLLQQPMTNYKKNFKASEQHILYSPQESCGRPFCKLKKQDHFHCNICSQAFSGFSRLHPHVSKHPGAPSPVPVYPPGYNKPSSPSSSLDELDDGEMSDIEEQSSSNGPLRLNSDETKETTEEQVSSSHQLFSWQSVSSSSSSYQPSMKCSIGISCSNLNQVTASSDSCYNSPQIDYGSFMDRAESPNNKVLDLKRNYAFKLDDSNEVKKMKMTALRILKDEPIPEGYSRCRFNEDCGYTHCGYREHQTHFHCMRKDCGYSFCDKTRFVQHTARHERLDTLMGGDFQQYRANVNCGRPECMYANTLGAMANKSSHFHCLKCDFVCTDTNKVVAHRRQHAKMDSIYAAGFEKYTPSQNCNTSNCNHNQKQTHYHCLKCQHAVLGLSQMSSHKYRHMD